MTEIEAEPSAQVDQPTRPRRWREAARTLRRRVTALYYAMLDPETPWYAMIFCMLVVAYALSPLDLIPDFIPILGHIDDFILLPIGVWIAIKLIPSTVMEAALKKAEVRPNLENPIGMAGAVFIILLYTLLGLWIWGYFFSS